MSLNMALYIKRCYLRCSLLRHTNATNLMKNHLRVVRSSGMYCKYLSKRPLLIFLRSFLSFQEPAQRDSQLFWRSWAQSLWWSFCHMDITLVDLILMTSDQGLLVIHLPSLTQAWQLLLGSHTSAGCTVTFHLSDVCFGR